MREIKFRAWDTYKKIWTEYKIHEGIVFFLDKNTGVWVGKYDEGYKEFDLMQYTGLKDMKGKEIYEGDILFETFREEYFKVVFENGSFRAEVDEYSLDLEDYANICEVVGNIYENAELMEDE